ncbi:MULTISPECIES: penicillin-binding protein 2 [Nitrosomonas]|uniref:Peptidoglycan D,D-transpeptidase MrdA n=1 Tax=Nitrosomonas communis TaxID=44574 RepID=A0A0F7KBQ3_9PROT|nr:MULTISPECIES: penicillin-binding protein 2 [Nitrosomonas]AKH37016.1 penicillin-binding protein [Nitrosomonas communis]TYP93239.1 penicillin-binding protein 2 [Nitrosomonas communis]UVS62158.1 penicillin-binding protein 2 [Nitrosomonas sp. PLL12]
MNYVVELRNHLRELRDFHIRLAIAAGFVVLLFCLLLARFFYLQVLRSEHYTTLAEANRIAIMPIVPNRGLIFDRNGEILAQNHTTYALEIVPNQVPNLEATIDELATVIEISPEDRRRFNKLRRESTRFSSLPIRLRLSDIEVASFAANRYRFPGMEIKARLLRHYPHAELLSHVIGYIGRISDKDLEQLENNNALENYRGSLHIGRIGLEQSYEKELHGITGFEQVETDAAGRHVRTLSRTPPVAGNDLTLSLDLKLQQAAESAFGDYRGALVAMDPKTGEILAFVSKPGFDPNLFIDGIDHVNWRLLNESIDKPLNNRALRGVYPPGSTFKPFMALAGLELGKRTADYAINDPGYFSLPGSSHRFRDWRPNGHGRVNLHKSLVISCDTYYYTLANDLGINNIFSFIGQFGFGKKTEIDIPGEVTGLLPSSDWKKKRFNQNWFPGDTISVGIGQGYNLATPVQLTFATMLLANNGIAYRPHFVKQVQDNKLGHLYENKPSQMYTLNLKKENVARVRNALVDVTRPGGTAAKAGANAAYTFAGKTGTSQVINIKQGERYVASKIQERHRDHALFIAYAPAEDPQIALTVLVENGGSGGSTAAPIARQVLDYFLLGKTPEPMPAEKANTRSH